MYLDIFSVLNTELLANVSCNSFAKALIAADYNDAIVALNNIKSFSTTNIISLIEFNYDDKTMCIGYLVEYDNDKDRYVIKLDDVVVADSKYNITATVANSEYICRTIYNNVTADMEFAMFVIQQALVAKRVKNDITDVVNKD